MAGEDEEKPGKPWLVRDVPERTRRLVKKGATSYGVTVAEMLELLVDAGVRDLNSRTPDSLGVRIHYAVRYLRDLGLPHSTKEAFQLMARLAAMTQQYQDGIPLEEIDTSDLLFLPLLVQWGLLPPSFEHKNDDA